MKTAMQELLDELDLCKLVEKHNLIMVRYIIEQCLEKEKEQIIDFAYGCVQHISREDIEEYYNKIYNQIK